jgi:cytochrome c556
MMRFRRTKISFGLLGVLLLASALEAQKAGSTKPSGAPPSGVRPDATVQEIMATTVVPSSKIVFEAVSTVTVQGKDQQTQPRTAAEWATVRAAALKMVEASKLIAMDGRHIARNLSAKGKEGELAPKQIEALLATHRPEWNKFARAFGDVAGTAARAAEKKDVDGVFGAAGDLDTACENCHLTFWYPDQEQLFKK